ncbi:MAG TPA: hypothetical protein VF412_09060 [Bdellovibrio sp.]|uniref:hypothetical protein n=1 Tax=Bdellovibrio sp. TaxID=28201 RepID=UPI002EDEA8DE
MANNLQRLTSVVLGLFLLSSAANAFDNYKEFKRDHWDFELGTQFFYSEANYVNMGTGTTSLTSGNHYQLLDVDFSTRYIFKDWSLFAEGTMSNAESKNSVATRTNSTLTQALLGMDFMMYDGYLQLVPELAALVPFQKISTSDDQVLNSEGVFEAWARITAQKDFGKARIYGWLGLDYRGEGRSYLMPWGVGLQGKFSQFKLGAELYGSQSITDDTDTSNKTIRNAYLNQVDAESYKFYSVNPSIVDTMLYATWSMTPAWSVQVNGGATVAGENAAAGYHVGGFIRYSFDLAAGYVPPDRYEPVHNAVPEGKSNMYQQDSELSSDKKVKRFREQTDDGVDQNLFKPAPTKRQVKPKTVDDELQQQMNDTEFQIELKQDRKKKSP